MFRSLLASAFILALASAASAAPSLTFTTTSLGGGLSAYDFTFHSNDALNSSAFASITFSSASNINQVAFNGTNVDSSANATTFDGILGYTKTADSWFYTPWAGNTIILNPSFPDGFNRSATTYGINGGTGSGSQITDSLIAHIVSASPVSWSGTFSRNGADSSTSGTTAVPEPASLALLGLSALALFTRRRTH